MLNLCKKYSGIFRVLNKLFNVSILTQEYVERENMIRRHRLRGPTVTMSIYLDPQTDLLILKAKDRSGRSKSAEALIRLRDHLEKFPDFYNSEMAEVIPNNLEPKSQN